MVGVTDAEHPIAAAYRGVRTRLTGLVADQPDEVVERTVPACPAWRVRDVIGHLAGGCEDIIAGNLEGVASDAWTGAQVERHRERPFPEVLAVWAEYGPQVEALAPHVPPRAAAQLIFDAATHEADVRGALGEPGARDSDAVAIGVDFLLRSLGSVAAAQGLPPLRVELGDEVRDLGEGEPVVVLRATPFEAMRAFGGRRSLAQIRALDWDGDPTAFEPLFTNDVLRPPPDDLVE